MRVQGKKIVAIGITNEQLLVRAGYSLMPDGGFTRRYDETYRFHCYVVRDGEHKGKIEIHTDKNKVSIEGRRFHIASRFMTKDERDRIKSFLPRPPQKPPKPRHMLPHADYLKAMAELKRERELTPP